jgi:uncharacterized protein (TIGR00251 family)
VIHAQPKASLTEFAGQHGDALKIRIAAPPSEGAANEEVCRFLAGRFHVPLSKVSLLSGRSSRRKRILLKDVKLEQVQAAVTLALSSKASS